jgi:hypothetical protein
LEQFSKTLKNRNNNYTLFTETEKRLKLWWVFYLIMFQIAS